MSLRLPSKSILLLLTLHQLSSSYTVCSSRKKHVALCLSGGARSFPSAVPTLLENFYTPYNATITTFLHLKLHTHSTKGKTRNENLRNAPVVDARLVAAAAARLSPDCPREVIGVRVECVRLWKVGGQHRSYLLIRGIRGSRS